MRFEIRYTTPAGAGGVLRVRAESPADAAALAREIHARSWPATKALRWAGPGASGESGWYSTRRLPARERARMTYGEPIPLA
jgi:hypothetical protein